MYGSDDLITMIPRFKWQKPPTSFSDFSKSLLAPQKECIHYVSQTHINKSRKKSIGNKELVVCAKPLLLVFPLLSEINVSKYKPKVTCFNIISSLNTLTGPYPQSTDSKYHEESWKALSKKKKKFPGEQSPLNLRLLPYILHVLHKVSKAISTWYCDCQKSDDSCHGWDPPQPSCVQGE